MFSCLKILVIIDVLRKKGPAMEKLKNIRFNLRFFNGSDEPESVHSVRELEEKLRNNQIAFDDFTAYFFSGQLQRWLECHGEKDLALLEKLRAIDKKATNKEIVKALFAALGFCFDEQEIDRMIVSYDFPKQLRMSAVKSKTATEASLKSIRDEIDSYEAICRSILDARNDYKVVEGLVQRLIDKFLPLLEIDITRFFKSMQDPTTGCPLAVLALLANNKTRKFFKLDDTGLKDGQLERYKKSRIQCNRWIICDRTTTRYRLFINNTEIQDWQKPFDCVENYGEAGEWRPLMPKGKKIMVLCNSGVAVKGENNIEGFREWDEGSMNGRFIVLDGCSYNLVYRSKAVFAYVEL